MPEETLFETERVMGREAVAEYLHTLADSVASGGDVTLRSGDQSVTLTPPSEVEFEGMEFVRFEDGLIVESHVVWDALGVLRQLGAVEPPGV